MTFLLACLLPLLCCADTETTKQLQSVLDKIACGWRSMRLTSICLQAKDHTIHNRHSTPPVAALLLHQDRPAVRAAHHRWSHQNWLVLGLLSYTHGGCSGVIDATRLA